MTLRKLIPSLLLMGVVAATPLFAQLNLSNQWWPTYYATKVGLATAASATDVATISGTNAGKVVVLKRVEISCTETTATVNDLLFVQRSTADTGGTSAAMTVSNFDPLAPPTQATVLSYTANPTVGTSLGTTSVKLACLAPGSVSPSDFYALNFGPAGVVQGGLILRGASAQFAVNLNSVTQTGSSYDITFFWIEPSRGSPGV